MQTGSFTAHDPVCCVCICDQSQVTTQMKLED